MDELELQIMSSEEASQAASTTFDLAETERAAAEAAAQETTETLQAAQKNFSQLSAEAEALRRILKNAQEGFQPVIDLLNVDSGLEKALAVALGDDLQAALDGSAPIFWRELPEFSNAAPLPGTARPLTQYVKGPAALTRVLSQIGVIENASEAEGLMAQLQPGQCLVTLDGGAWRWDGLTVSADAENAAAIRLQQKNRLAEVETDLAAAETALNDARTADEAARQRRSEAANALNAARQSSRQAEETLSGLRRRHTALTSQLSEVTAKLSSISTSIENAAQEIGSLTEQLDNAREHFAALPDTAQSRERIALLKGRLGEDRQLLAKRQAYHAEIEREGENRARRIAQIASDVTDWQNRIERIGTRLVDLQVRISEAQETLDRLAERPAQIEQEKQELMSRISTAEKGRQEAADVLVAAETAANDLSRDLRACEQSLSDARESRAMTQASVNTTQHTQSGIEASIHEKFSCTPENLVSKLELKVEELGEVDAWQSKLERLLRERDNMGPVNLRADLVAAIGKLREGINTLNKEARTRLLSAFDMVNTHFQKLFTRLFNGGTAYLKLIEAEDPLDSGLEIYATPPGKKTAVLSLLSGGEQTLTSIALIFAMFLTNPAPICVLDEVDAPLDESNVDRYCTLLEDLVKECATRFVVITHHRMTMARMDRLYGVTMSEKGVSQLVSVDLKQHALLLDEAA